MIILAKWMRLSERSQSPDQQVLVNSTYEPRARPTGFYYLAHYQPII